MIKGKAVRRIVQEAEVETITIMTERVRVDAMMRKHHPVVMFVEENTGRTHLMTKKVVAKVIEMIFMRGTTKNEVGLTQPVVWVQILVVIVINTINKLELVMTIQKIIIVAVNVLHFHHHLINVSVVSHPCRRRWSM